VRIKLQLMVAVAAAVAVTALTMSALAIGQNQPTTEAGTQPAGKAAFPTSCLAKAEITVPDGLSPIEFKQWIGEHPDAMKALEACDPAPDGRVTTFCKVGKDATGAPTDKPDAKGLHTTNKKAQSSSSSAR
jgi:hypothetical protein